MYLFKRKRPFPVPLVFLYYTRPVSNDTLWTFAGNRYFTGAPILFKSAWTYVLEICDSTINDTFMTSAHHPDPFFIQSFMCIFQVSDRLMSDAFIVAVERELLGTVRALIRFVSIFTLETANNYIQNGWYTDTTKSVIQGEIHYRYKNNNRYNKKQRHL